MLQQPAMGWLHAVPPPPQGCFTHLGGHFIRVDQLLGWELVMTFLLVSVVFAVAISRPGHGNIGPLAVVGAAAGACAGGGQPVAGGRRVQAKGKAKQAGSSHIIFCWNHCSLISLHCPLGHPAAQGYTLFASAFIGGPLTGAALNPARVLGPALIYNCYWNTAFVYMLAQYLGGAIAAVTALLLYGPGPEHGGDLEAEAELAGMAAGRGPPDAGHAAKANERQGLIAMTANTSSAAAPAHWEARY
jgi:glycerol uptake facilitator-like aquaporin